LTFCLNGANIAQMKERPESYKTNLALAGIISFSSFFAACVERPVTQILPQGPVMPLPAPDKNISAGVDNPSDQKPPENLALEPEDKVLYQEKKLQYLYEEDLPEGTTLRIESVIYEYFDLPDKIKGKTRFFKEVREGVGLGMPGIPGQTVEFILPPGVNLKYVEKMGYPWKDAQIMDKERWIVVDKEVPFTVRVIDGYGELITNGPFAFQVGFDKRDGLQTMRNEATVFLPDGQVYEGRRGLAVNSNCENKEPVVKVHVSGLKKERPEEVTLLVIQKGNRNSRVLAIMDERDERFFRQTFNPDSKYNAGAADFKVREGEEVSFSIQKAVLRIEDGERKPFFGRVIDRVKHKIAACH